MSTDIPQLDWQDWMHRYDQQQSTYLPDREKRFTAMLDVLEMVIWVKLRPILRSHVGNQRQS